MNVLDLFSGIGGFSLGLERAGMRTVAFCEIEPYCRAVLRKHWPDVPIYEDVRTINCDSIAADVVCGGFPCQPWSVAGEQNGFTDDRDLWPEMFRVINAINARWVIAENVPGFASNGGLGRTAHDLESVGYHLSVFEIPAFAVGAPHMRRRLWIVAHADRKRLQGLHGPGGGKYLQRIEEPVWRHWEAEPSVPRVDYGVPRRMVVDSIRALGNAIVPQIPEIIGRAILEAEGVGA